MKIAAVMCTWEEPNMAPLAIESVKDYVDEIVCVDKPGPSRTDLIVQEACDMWGLPCKIYRNDMRLRDARLYAFWKSDADWIVVLDGDEVYHTDGPGGAHRFRELIETGPRACVYRAPMNYLYLDLLHTRTSQPQMAGHRFLYRNEGVKPAGLRDLPQQKGPIVNLPDVYKFNCGVKPLPRIFMRRKHWVTWSKRYDGPLDFDEWLFTFKGKRPEDLVPRDPYAADDVVLYDPEEWGPRPKIIKEHIERGMLTGFEPRI